MKRISTLCIVVLVALMGGVSGVGAYSTYETAPDAGGNCSQCHPGFVGGFGAPLHNAHNAFSSTCSRCHVVTGDNPVIDLDASQNTGCAGCHGRLEDGAADIGAGLRLHHANAGAPADSSGLVCSQCHSGDPAVPVAEDVFPPFFDAEGLDPCTDNLDDDGDLLSDGDDPDCAAPECTVDADCDNGLFCDGAETCNTATGTCVAGTPPSCDDGVACTDDSCNPSLDGCVNTPNDANCDDGDVCSGIETCDPFYDCQPGDPLVCDDGSLCTTDSCHPVAGCVFTPVECPAGEQCDPADGQCKLPPGCTVDADCDDGLFCNGSETCDVASGICQPGTPVECDDGIACTVDTCDEVKNECAYTPDDAACPDDGLFCTGQEICDPIHGCISTGDPCPKGTTCNEDTGTCDMVAAEKVTICHKGKNTISVGAAAVFAHLAHGDTLGPCPNGEECDEEDDGEECDEEEGDSEERDNGEGLEALPAVPFAGCSVIQESMGHASPGGMFFMYSLVAGYVGILRRLVRRKADSRKEHFPGMGKRMR